MLDITKARLPESVILAKVRGAGTRFDLRSGALMELKRAGVSDRVLEAMVNAGGERQPGSGSQPQPTAAPKSANAPKTSPRTPVTASTNKKPSGSSDKGTGTVGDTIGGMESSGGFGQPGSAVSPFQGQLSISIDPQRLAARYDKAFEAATNAALELGYTTQIQDRRNGRLSFVRLGSATVPALALEVLFVKRSDGGRDVKITAQLASPPLSTSIGSGLAHMMRTTQVSEIKEHPAIVRRAIETAINQ